MTPFGLALQHRLEVETRRMQNEWFFKWHFIGKDGPVEIDSFDGRTLKYGGVGFSGTSREVYWDTLKRYISGKIDEIFVELERILPNYPLQIAIQTIVDTKSLLVSFNRRIADIAVEKDKILRGNGFEFPTPDRGRASGVLQTHEIEQRANALTVVVDLKLAVMAVKSKPSNPTSITPSKNKSFREFKDDLLIAIAIRANGEPTSQLVPVDVAKSRQLFYRSGWLRQAVEALGDQGFVDASFYLGGGEDGGMHVQITGAGLEAAEELCDNRGSDLYEEIDNLSEARFARTEDGEQVPASDRIVQLDHNSDLVQSIQNNVDKILDSATSSNSLSADSPNEKEQNIAELKAGREILKAPQVEIGLVQRLIIKPLKWLASTIADTSIKELIKILIGMIIKIF